VEAAIRNFNIPFQISKATGPISWVQRQFVYKPQVTGIMRTRPIITQQDFSADLIVADVYKKTTKVASHTNVAKKGFIFVAFRN
jgi:hypothetical protein